MRLFDKIRQIFSPSLSCEQVNGFLADYLEGRLSPEIRRQFEAHMEMCPSCAPFLEQYRQTVRLVHDEGQVDVPPGLIEHTLHFLQEHRHGAEGAAT